MQKNSENFSLADAMRLANSDAGKRLLGILKQTDPRQLRQAMTYVEKGDYEKAKQSLSGILAAEEAKAAGKGMEG